MRLILELVLVAGLAGIAVSALAWVLIGLSFPWTLDESERQQSFVKLSRDFGRGAVGIVLYRYRDMWLRLTAAGALAVVGSGAVLLLVWGE